MCDEEDSIKGNSRWFDRMNMRIIRNSWDRAALFDVCAVNSKSTHSTVKQSPKKVPRRKDYTQARRNSDNKGVIIKSPWNWTTNCSICFSFDAQSQCFLLYAIRHDTFCFDLNAVWVSHAGHTQIRDKIFISWSGSCSRITTILNRISHSALRHRFSCATHVEFPIHELIVPWRSLRCLNCFCDCWQPIFIFVIFVIFLCLTSISFCEK